MRLLALIAILLLTGPAYAIGNGAGGGMDTTTTYATATTVPESATPSAREMRSYMLPQPPPAAAVRSSSDQLAVPRAIHQKIQELRDRRSTKIPIAITGPKAAPIPNAAPGLNAS